MRFPWGVSSMAVKPGVKASGFPGCIGCVTLFRGECRYGTQGGGQTDMRQIFSVILAAALVFGGALFMAEYFTGLEVRNDKPAAAQKPRDSKTRTVKKTHERPRVGPYSCTPAGSGAYRPPKADVRAAPKYPRRAIASCANGYVLVRFCVETNGSTSGVVSQQSSPEGLFDKEATRALEKWKFQPATTDGVPVRVCDCTVPLTFELDGAEDC